MAPRNTSKTALTALIVLGLLVNLGLSYYIQAMKERNYAIIPEELRGQCFEGAEGGVGCGAVQTSAYSSTFGISNPYAGFVGFPILALLVTATWLLSRRKHQLTTLVARGTLVGLLLGSLFSIWLLFVQFFLIHLLCVYCLWVDGIMLVVTVLFAWQYARELSGAAVPRVSTVRRKKARR